MSILSPLVAVVMMFTVGVPTATDAEPPIPTIQQEEIIINYDTEIVRLSEKYGFDLELAKKIIKCESLIYGQDAENKNYRMEWNAELGTTTRTHWSTDIGFWQINDYWHKETAKKMGYNIYDWKDNLEYGAILLSRDGERHWSASKYCWDK